MTQTTPMNNLPATRTPNGSNTRINQDKKKKKKKANQQRLSKHEKGVFLIDLNKKKKKKKETEFKPRSAITKKKSIKKTKSKDCT